MADVAAGKAQDMIQLSNGQESGIGSDGGAVFQRPVDYSGEVSPGSGHHRNLLLRVKLIGVDGAIAVGVHVVLGDDPAGGIPPVTELGRVLVLEIEPVIRQIYGRVKLIARVVNFSPPTPEALGVTS